MRIQQLLGTTLALGLAVTALTTAAWATPPTSCQYTKFKIRYYASPADDSHHKRVITYCDYNEKPISCEAEIFSSSDSPNEQHKYFVALNEVHEYKNGTHDKHDPYYNRSGCWARANTFSASYDGFHEDKDWQPLEESSEESSEEPSEEPTKHDHFFWGLKVYATCVPQYCVEKYETHDGSYESYEHPFTSEEVSVE